jgi:Tfp pilus assembly protein PilF
MILCYVSLLRHDHDRAERLVDPVLRRSPRLAKAHAVKGTILEHRMDDDAALAELAKAVELDPDDGKPLAARSSILLRRSNFDAAIADLRTLARLSPGTATVHANLGAALHHVGKSDESIRELERARELAPGESDTHKNLVAVLRAIGDADAERAAVKAWIEACPDQALPLLLAAELLIEDAAADPARDLATGLAWVDRAVRLEPSVERFALVDRVRLLLWAGRFDEAEAAVRQARQAVAEGDDFRGKLDQLLVDCRRARRDARRAESRPQSTGQDAATRRGGR